MHYILSVLSKWDDDLTRSKHVGVILSVFKVFNVKVMSVQLLVLWDKTPCPKVNTACP